MIENMKKINFGIKNSINPIINTEIGSHKSQMFIVQSFFKKSIYF